MKYPEYKSLDLVQTADEILRFWEANQVFEKSVSSREGKPAFTFYEGPPSANGAPGIHHVMARAIKDIFCRYKTLKGYQVKRKGGWDTHGLPVELQVEKELGITKEDIGKSISIAEYNQKCKETVMRFKEQWDDLTKKMGYWVDLENPYITFEKEYIESLWALLKKLYDKGMLYKGYTIQPYSPAAGTGLSSHELNLPGCYRDVKDTSVTAQFKVKQNERSAKLFNGLSANAELFVLAWTTTPWTLPSNAALAVGEKIDYVRVRTFNQYTFAEINVILAKDLLSKHFTDKQKEASFADYKAGDKVIPFEVTASFKGADLVGVQYEQLLPYVQPEGKAFEVIPGDFVSTEDGTGIVHISPTFGADDKRVGDQAGISAITVKDENGKDVPLVNKQGKFVDEVTDFAGKYVKEEYYPAEVTADKDFKPTDVLIAIKLKEANRAFKVEKYEHSYPHCWRTDKPVLYYPLDSWFIKTTAVKDKMLALNNTINWKPAATGTGRFGEWLKNLVDWNLSRSRFWGTPLPIWRSEDESEEICIGSVAELSAEIDKAVEAGFMERNPIKTPPQPLPPEGKGSSSSPFPTGGRAEDGVDPEENTYGAPFYNSPPEKWKHLKDLARKNRKEPTKAEEKMWQLLRGKKVEGFKFRRQHSIEDFIVDFVTLEKQLIVEVDGGIHNQPEEKEYDQWRTEALNHFGFKVIRFTNEQVLENESEVIAHISKELMNDPDRSPQREGRKTALIPLPSEGKGLGDGVFDLHRPYVDEVTLVSPSGKPMKRELDLIDVWFDSGAMPYAQWHYPFENESTFKGSFPADFISEGVDQTRGWFFTLHAIAVMLEDSVAFKNVVSTGLVLDKNGQKMSKRLGNAVNPFETLSTYGADVTRWYMIENAPPWENLKFNLDGIDESRRKFFGTLYNTYSFFSLYANLDGFSYQEADIPLANRKEDDRWILSRLNSLIKEVDEAFEQYEPTRAARAIEDFTINDMSNWYVRLNRKRFWKGDYGQDKQSAYQTLYRCLETIAQLMSPIAPFFAERLFLDLNKVSGKHSVESVHLSDFPTVNATETNTDLEEKMKLAQIISSLTHSIRKKEKLKVRQPLSRILIPDLNEKLTRQIKEIEEVVKSEVNIKGIDYIDDQHVIEKKIKPNFPVLGQKGLGKLMKPVQNLLKELDQAGITQLEQTNSLKLEVEGQTVELTSEDVIIETSDIPGWAIAKEGAITVALDITLTDDLKKEGIARELVNRIQNIRKDQGFEVQDKINITVQKGDALIDAAVTDFASYIQEEVQALSLNLADSVSGTELEMDELKVTLSVEKA